MSAPEDRWLFKFIGVLFGALVVLIVVLVSVDASRKKQHAKKSDEFDARFAEICTAAAGKTPVDRVVSEPVYFYWGSWRSLFEDETPSLVYDHKDPSESRFHWVDPYWLDETPKLDRPVYKANSVICPKIENTEIGHCNYWGNNSIAYHISVFHLRLVDVESADLVSTLVLTSTEPAKAHYECPPDISLPKGTTGHVSHKRLGVLRYNDIVDWAAEHLSEVP